MWGTECSSNHLSNIFCKGPLFSKCCLWALSQVDMWNVSHLYVKYFILWVMLLLHTIAWEPNGGCFSLMSLKLNLELLIISLQSWGCVQFFCSQNHVLSHTSQHKQLLDGWTGPLLSLCWCIKFISAPLKQISNNSLTTILIRCMFVCVCVCNAVTFSVLSPYVLRRGPRRRRRRRQRRRSQTLCWWKWRRWRRWSQWQGLRRATAFRRVSGHSHAWVTSATHFL